MDLWKSWNLHFVRCPPIGFLLRRTAGDRWIRVYNLPNAKRWPSSKSEVAQVRDRQNLVAGFVLDDPAEVIVWSTSFSHAAPGQNWIRAPRRLDWSRDIAEYFAREPRFYYRQMRWESGGLNDEFAAVARDERDPLVVLSPNTGATDLILSARRPAISTSS